MLSFEIGQRENGFYSARTDRITDGQITLSNLDNILYNELNIKNILNNTLNINNFLNKILNINSILNNTSNNTLNNTLDNTH